MKLDLDILIELSKPSNARALNSQFKRLYRHLIAELFVDIIFSNNEHFTITLLNTQDIYFNDIIGRNRQKISEQECNVLEEEGYFYLNQYDVMVSNSVEVNELAKFAHEFFKNLQTNNQTLYKYKDVKWWLNLEKKYNSRVIRDFSWVDLKPFSYTKAPVLTYPEFFTYQDLINTWNVVLEKENQLNELYESSHNQLHPLYRSTNHAYYSFMRTSLILAVNFVESYLFYYYYNIKEAGKYQDIEIVTRGSRSTVKGVDIISDLILQKYSISDESFDRLVGEYNSLYLFRHRLVHLSAFEFDNSNLSELQPLINDDEISIANVASKLDSCIRLVVTIEENLLEDEKLLFWWNTMEYPDFSSMKSISNIRK